VRDVASARARELTVKFSVAMASSMRERVGGETYFRPVRTDETVLRETPATRATSPMVATNSPPLPLRPNQSSLVVCRA
jgi:hypothetical protein